MKEKETLKLKEKRGEGRTRRERKRRRRRNRISKRKEKKKEFNKTKEDKELFRIQSKTKRPLSQQQLHRLDKSRKQFPSIGGIKNVKSKSSSEPDRPQRLRHLWRVDNPGGIYAGDARQKSTEVLTLLRNIV